MGLQVAAARLRRQSRGMRVSCLRVHRTLLLAAAVLPSQPLLRLGQHAVTRLRGFPARIPPIHAAVARGELDVTRAEVIRVVLG